MMVVLLVLGVLAAAKGASSAVDRATGKTWANERLGKSIAQARNAKRPGEP